MPKNAPRTGLLGSLAAAAAVVVRYLAARRALAPILLSIGYVATLGGHVRDGSGRPWLVGGLALACGFVAAGPTLPGNGLREDGRRAVGPLAYAVWMLGLVLASLDARAADPVQDVCGALAALWASGLAARALARIEGGHGVADALPRAPRGQLVATVLLLVVVAGVAAAASARMLRDPAGSGADPLPHDAHSVAAVAALVVLAGATWETLQVKRLVLGAGDRALIALGTMIATSIVAAGLLLLGQGATDRVLRLALAGASVAVTYACLAGDPERLGRRGRRAIALLLFGGPFVLLGGLAAEGPGRSELPLLVTGAVALGIGSAITYLELPLRRADGHLLDAVATAEAALIRADPESSVREALASLRTFAGLASHSPELWSIVPPRVLTIDGAGYAHERTAELPRHLLEIARGEPEATVRTELLEALTVRRPDLRPLARWMDERGALSATLVTRDREVEGVLVLPRGARRVPMSLEEVRSLRRLADAFSGAAAARAALERSLERERLATLRASEAEAQLLVRERAERKVLAHDRILTARLAEAAATGAAGPYSPGARLAYEALERRVAQGSPVVVVAPGGADVVPYLARMHLAGPRAAMPFVVVDGASRQHHELARWLDPIASPLALAHSGRLVLEDGSRLPREVQRVVGEAIAQRRAPWQAGGGPQEPLDVALAMTMGRAPRRIATGADGVEPALFAVLDEALAQAVAWPPLRERGEDLRSLVLAGLAREGVAVQGAPLGIEDAAYEKLADYPFPGEDAELRAILKRLARLAGIAHAPRVRTADVESLGLAGARDGASEPPP